MNLDWSKGSEALTYLKGLGNKVKQIALQLTEIEIKVEDATNNDPWGPHGKDMAGMVTQNPSPFPGLAVFIRH
jgi:epsin